MPERAAKGHQAHIVGQSANTPAQPSGGFLAPSFALEYDRAKLKSLRLALGLEKD